MKDLRTEKEVQMSEDKHTTTIEEAQRYELQRYMEEEFGSSDDLPKVRKRFMCDDMLCGRPDCLFCGEEEPDVEGEIQ